MMIGPGPTLEAPARRSAPLSRAALAERDGSTADAPPVRIVHLGLGAFHRAHQAWYTAVADDAAAWGIAAFTGRSATAAELLSPQDGLYTMIERSDAGDVVSVVTSIAEVVDGADLRRFVELVAAPTTAIVTLTITEPGYRLTAEGFPDTDDPAVAADIVRLTRAFSRQTIDLSAADDTAPRTSLGRLLMGLEARRRAQTGPIAIVSCDNVPENGTLMRRGLIALADLVSEKTATWLGSNASFVSTSVDRITPKATEADIRTARAMSGWIDRSPVVTEPFRDWVLQGEFPAGRPAWESAGARFVEDIEPFERRKLWLLNGAHSLLAYAGRLRGHETVAQAIADAELRDRVTDLWDEASRHLPVAALDLDEYRAALLRRFANARIEHRLTQIGMEGVTKLRVRSGAIALAERAAGRDANASAYAIGAWIALLQTGVSVPDAHSAAVSAALGGDSRGVVRRLLGVLDSRLALDTGFVASVESAVTALG